MRGGRDPGNLPEGVEYRGGAVTVEAGGLRSLRFFFYRDENFSFLFFAWD